ncbi:hypothetical protein V8C86DRAFT_2855112 [Haematococcus lacustris]
MLSRRLQPHLHAGHATLTPTWLLLRRGCVAPCDSAAAAGRQAAARCAASLAAAAALRASTVRWRQLDRLGSVGSSSTASQAAAAARLPLVEGPGGVGPGLSLSSGLPGLLGAALSCRAKGAGSQLAAVETRAGAGAGPGAGAEEGAEEGAGPGGSAGGGCSLGISQAGTTLAKGRRGSCAAALLSAAVAGSESAVTLGASGGLLLSCKAAGKAGSSSTAWVAVSTAGGSGSARAAWLMAGTAGTVAVAASELAPGLSEGAASCTALTAAGASGAASSAAT